MDNNEVEKIKEKTKIINDRADRIQFGRRLKILRINKNLTQAELAEKLNLSQPTIFQYESGSRKVPLDVLKKLAKFYDLTLDELIEPEETEEQKKVKNLFTSTFLNGLKRYNINLDDNIEIIDLNKNDAQLLANIYKLLVKSKNDERYNEIINSLNVIIKNLDK